MVALRLAAFAGMWPIKAVRQLPDTGADQAENFRPDSGALRGVNAPVPLRAVQATTRSVFRIPTGPTNDLSKSFWMEFADPDTDVVRGPTVNDSFERYYWASPSQGLRFAPKANIVAGSETFVVGILPPAAAPTLTVVEGTGALDPKTGKNTAPKVTRAYVVTYTSAFGEESQPSPAATAEGATDADWLLRDIPQPVADTTRAPIAKITIYRTVTASSGTTTFFKVATVLPGQVIYTDRASDSVITSNNQLDTTTWAPPPAGLQGLALMPNGIMVGFIGNNLYFSENYRPHAWPAEYTITVEHAIVGLGVFGNTCVVCTQGRPAAVSGVKSSTLSLVSNTAPMPCLSRRSIVSAPDGVMYASENGLASFGPGGVSYVTASLVGRDRWVEEYRPSNIRAIFMDGVYTAIREREGTDDGFMFSPALQELGIVGLTELGQVTNCGLDAWSGKPWLLADGMLYQWLPPTGTSLTYRWRSKEFQVPSPVNMAVIQAFYDYSKDTVAPGRLRVWCYQRGDTKGTKRLVYDEPLGYPGQERKLPAGYVADLWQVEVEANVKVHSVILASSVSELRGG